MLRAARDEFRALLDARAKEPAWQTFFAANPFVFSASLPVRIPTSDIVPLGRNGRSEADFVFYPKGGSTLRHYGVIELKRPDTTILQLPRRNLITLSRDAATALRQAQDYAARLKRKLQERHSAHAFFGNPAQLFLVMGMSEEIVRKLPHELGGDSQDGLFPSNCRPIPYDTLLEYFEQSVPPAIIPLVPLRIVRPEGEITVSTPPPSRTVVLVGMPGANTYAIGLDLARRWGIPFENSSQDVEAAAGMQIADILVRHGEAAFREGERRVIARLLDGPPQVLTLGAGAFLDAETRERIRNTAVSVWVRADLDTLVARIENNPYERAELGHGDLKTLVRRLLEARAPSYGHADVTVDGGQAPAGQVADAIVQGLQRIARGRAPKKGKKGK